MSHFITVWYSFKFSFYLVFGSVIVFGPALVLGPNLVVGPNTVPKWSYYGAKSDQSCLRSLTFLGLVTKGIFIYYTRPSFQKSTAHRQYRNRGIVL